MIPTSRKSSHHPDRSTPASPDGRVLAHQLQLVMWSLGRLGTIPTTETQLDIGNMARPPEMMASRSDSAR